MAACTCSPCGRAFTGLTAFDRHQVIAYGTAHPVTCHDPATRGLVQQASGRWGFPIDDEARAALAALRGPSGSGDPGTRASSPEAVYGASVTPEGSTP